MKNKNRTSFLSVSFFPLKSCYFFLTFFCIFLFSINSGLRAESVKQKTDTNYGKLYIDFLKSKSSSFLSREGNINESQMVFSLVPNRYEYENSHFQCKQLCILSADLFFNTQSLKSYAEYFINNLKLMTNKMGMPSHFLHYGRSYKAQKM